MRRGSLAGGTALTVWLCSQAVAAQDPSMVLKDGGLEFPDGTVQETSAVVLDPPWEVTVNVDCGGGDSVTDALREPAGLLTIEISGICNENVLVTRPNVTFRGTDPTLDGIHAAGRYPWPYALSIHSTFSVDIESLQLSGSTGGAAGGLSSWNSADVKVYNCRFEDSSYVGAVLVGGDVVMDDTVVTGNGEFGLMLAQSTFLKCDGCTIDDNGPAGLGTGIVSYSSNFDLEDSVVEGQTAIEMYGGQLHTESAFPSSIVALPGSEGSGVALELTDHASLVLEASTVTGPMNVVMSDVVLEDVTQTMPTGFLSDNEVNGDAGIYALGTTSLAGSIHLFGFAKAFFSSGASLTGDLDCQAASDVYCDDSAVISGSSNCDSCIFSP